MRGQTAWSRDGSKLSFGTGVDRDEVWMIDAKAVPDLQTFGFPLPSPEE